MARGWKGPTLEQQRARYKEHQTRAAVFGVDAKEFNEKVKGFLKKQNPTSTEWVYGAWQVIEKVSMGRCCTKAQGRPCVCEVSYTCPDHGTRCIGSHD